MSKLLSNYNETELSAYLRDEFESFELDRIDKALEAVVSVDFESFDDASKCMLYYNIANGWSYKESLTRNEPDFVNETISKQIYYIRLAILHFQSTPDLHKSQILTNLGNLYSRLGRFQEAIKIWHKALEYTPNFGMALGNVGQAIYNYGGVIYDDRLQILCLHISYRLLKQSCSLKSTQDNAKEVFQQIIDGIEAINDPKIFDEEIKYNDVLKDESAVNANYRKWCIKNTLVLNLSNDIVKHNATAYDDLYMPSIVIMNLTFPNPKKDFYFSMFDEIKQQYVSARYFVYKGLERGSTHFSDKNNFLAMKLDYSNYSYNLELMKSGFKQCYSILDKIAYFLHEYMQFSGKKDAVNFKNVWFDNKKTRSVFVDSNNYAFRALFCMAKDLNYRKDSDKLNPEAETMAILRNYMEHRSLNIVDYCEKAHISDDELTFTISRQDFADKCIELLNFVRAAILNLMIGIHINELNREIDDSVYLMRDDYTSLDDDWKI